ncbi:putative multidrug resistance-associated protein 2, 6, abc-transoprter [Coniochaeta sp. PMI_546]|nr:putative multidrug resistance-associated protein 2, 6, abc-transoprter [Coniochaeta sp. PMI_546]
MWSRGERQLLSLARASLVPSKLLIFNEAMSNVDEHTEALMQETIFTEFKDRTIIAIMHRYTCIEHFDRVLVMKNGSMVEFDTPATLLGRADSALRKLYDAKS